MSFLQQLQGNCLKPSKKFKKFRYKESFSSPAMSKSLNKLLECLESVDDPRQSWNVFLSLRESLADCPHVVLMILLR